MPKAKCRGFITEPKTKENPSNWISGQVYHVEGGISSLKL
jgi:hypothetical protein